jgi:hypothetical protein
MMIKKFMKRLGGESRIQELDRNAVKAMFGPAIVGMFRFVDRGHLQWTEPDFSHKASSFRDALLEVSEFYAEHNPPLSAALWGIARMSPIDPRRAITKRMR